MAIEVDKTHGAARRGNHGMTLIEVIISVLIVGVMLVAALSTLAGSAKARVVQQAPSACQALARQLLAEVMQAAYEDPEDPGGFGPEADEGTATRADFDDVDDYDRWQSYYPQAKDGAPLEGYPQCVRAVNVAPIDPHTLGPGSMGGDIIYQQDPGLKEIHVYVGDGDGDWYVAQGLRSKYDTRSVPSTEAKTIVTWVGIDLEIGSGGYEAVHTGVNLVNQPEDTQGN